MHNEAIKMAKWAMADALAKGYDNMNSQDWDDFKDCVETAKNAIKCDYYYRLVECMKKEEEEDKREDKYFLDMLKEEHADEYKRMREEYGEDEGERRFYDAWRYKSSGRYAPKGKGTRYGRRGYTEPMYHMPLDMYHEYTPEELRDWDRDKGRLYFTPSNTENGGMNNASSSQSNGNSGDTRSYSDGFNDGQTRGYSEGYERGRNDGSRNNSSRYDNARRGYSESKQNHRGNSPEDNSENMRNLEKVLNIIAEDVKEYMPNMSPSEKAMAKQKIDGISKSIQ